MLKFKIKNVIFNILLLYPIINLIACIIFNGNNMNIISFLFAAIIICLNNKNIYKLSKEKCLLLFFLMLVVGVSFVREDLFSNRVIALLYATTVMMFACLADSPERINELKERVLIDNKKIYICQCLYLVILLLYVAKHGMQYGWNTMVLQGPYNYPHTLAYILLFMSCLSAYIAIRKKSIVATCLCGVEFALIILTAVRSVCVAIAIMGVFICWLHLTHKGFKRLLVLLIIGSVGIFVAWEKGLFDAFIAKTMLAVQGGYGLTNNRLNTLISSLDTFRVEKYYPLNIVFGVGLEALYNNNFRILGESIHAHNDFVDALVSYGVISLLVYVVFLVKMCKANAKKYCWLLVFLGVLIFYNGLFTYIDVMPILLYPIVLFSCEKIK